MMHLSTCMDRRLFSPDEMKNVSVSEYRNVPMQYSRVRTGTSARRGIMSLTIRDASAPASIAPHLSG